MCVAADNFFLENKMESLALLVAAILLFHIVIAIVSFGLTFTKFKFLSLGFAVVSIAIGWFTLFTTPMILLPSINIVAGIIPIVNLIFKK